MTEEAIRDLVNQKPLPDGDNYVKTQNQAYQNDDEPTFKKHEQEATFKKSSSYDDRDQEGEIITAKEIEAAIVAAVSTFDPNKTTPSKKTFSPFVPSDKILLIVDGEDTLMTGSTKVGSEEELEHFGKVEQSEEHFHQEEETTQETRDLIETASYEIPYITFDNGKAVKNPLMVPLQTPLSKTASRGMSTSN